jgi:DNA-binding winged helix-turn-helix (wHTH) protein/predicted ATPase
MIYGFGDYELDLQRYELRRAGTLVKLEPQVFNVLVYLIRHRDHVVTKEELFEQVWPGRVVSEAALTSRLMAARKAVGDTGRRQRLIQTLHGRGYRFIADVEERAGGPAVPAASGRPFGPSAAIDTGQPRATFISQPKVVASPMAPMRPGMVAAVGRETELEHLHHWLRRALNGTRQIVFVTGEAGMGKTTLVETFLAEIGRDGALRIGRGQCIEHYGVGEAYLPVLEALGRLCKEPDGQALIGVLAQRAPTWLVQMPWLVDGVEFETLQRRVLGATRERMLREMAETIEALTVERPLVLVLEDLHWSDYATLDLVSLLARRREPARLLLLGTYRPEAVGASGHPLQGVMAALQLRQQCQELAVSALSATEVEAYLAAYFMNDAVAVALGPVLHRRSEGNPLFMVTLLEHWMAHGWLHQQGEQWTLRAGWEAIAQEIPATLRELVMQRQAQLSPSEQRLLEVASVAGLECSAASIAAGLEAEVVETEAWCEELARRGQFLQACGVETWPDGTVATRYRFQHALYQDAVYERIPAARQIQLHQRIGAREEAGYGERSSEIAARLAMHFERGHDLPRAVQYLQMAGAQAVQRSAHHEAFQHLTRGLALLATLPETPARTQRELDLQIALGPVLIAIKGAGAPEVEQTYARARALCAQVGETPQLVSALRGLCRFYRSRGALPTARELGEQLDRLAQRDGVPMHRLEAHDALGGTLFYLGEYAAARMHLEQGIALINQTAQRELVLHHGVALGVRCLTMDAWTLWCLGYPAQALRRSQEALALAQTLDHPYSLALAQHYAACLHHHRRETLAVQAQAEALIPLGMAQGFPLWEGFGTFWRGWVLARQGQDVTGLAEMRQGLALVEASGQTVSRPLCLVLLAEAAACAGQVEEGLRLLAEAFTALETSGRGDMLAEAYRLQGELQRQQPAPDIAQAEVCFHRALAVARRQQAKSWELRAALSLCRLWQSQGRHTAARELLAPLYGCFTEGFDTADLLEAKALLEALA